MKHVLTVLITALIFFTALLPAMAAPTSQRAAGATHVVQRGDTLYSIAREYGTTVDGLKAANGLNSNVIWIGQVLVVGASGSSAQATHTVVRGDTLFSLSRRYGTSVDAIMRANGLTNANIYAGQHLVIATLATPVARGTTYTVVRGDTLYAIARRYGTTADALMALNRLSSASIYVGQHLVIAGNTTPLPPLTALPTATATPTVGGTPVPTLTPTVTPLTTPLPTPTTTPTSSGVIIQHIEYDSAVPQSEGDEYVVIVNNGATSQNLNGWRLYADDAGQNFFFPNIDLAPGQGCRVYTNEIHTETCGFSYGRGSAVWNNDGDCGTLFNASNAVVSSFCYE